MCEKLRKYGEVKSPWKRNIAPQQHLQTTVISLLLGTTTGFVPELFLINQFRLDVEDVRPQVEASAYSAATNPCSLSR